MSNTDTHTPSRPVTTYGPRRQTPTAMNGHREIPHSSATLGSTSHGDARRSNSSSTLSPAPDSASPVRKSIEVDEEDQGEEEMDFDIDENLEDGHMESIAGLSEVGEADDAGSEWSDDDTTKAKVILHVEVRRAPRRPDQKSVHSNHTLKKMLEAYVRSMEAGQMVGTDLDLEEWGSEPMLRNVDKVYFAETEPASETFDPKEVEVRYHFYQPSVFTELEQFTAVTEDDDEEDAVPAASVRELPSMELEGIWENLIYSTDLKPRLLRYINSTMAFSDARVDFNKVSWNRLVLLHGPPGTGKTSLCRALAQKLLVRMGDTTGKLVEINSHSLFSKWFSESGKLVQKLFSRVTDMVEDQRCLVVVMIDEVESLTAARSAAVSGSEPSDALRVVNALLTQLDKLKTRQNVLVLTTSNIPDSIDSAFIDRADEKFYVGYPPPDAIFWILKGCLTELGDRGMMRPCGISTSAEVKQLRTAWRADLVEGVKAEPKGQKKRLRGKEREKAAALTLLNIAHRCYDANLAGRFLRRLPLLAHSHYLSVTTKVDGEGRPKPRSIEKWLEAFGQVVHDEIEERARIGKKTNTTLANRDEKEEKEGEEKEKEKKKEKEEENEKEKEKEKKEKGKE